MMLGPLLPPIENINISAIAALWRVYAGEVTRTDVARRWLNELAIPVLALLPLLSTA